ncbi:MAG: hypothetical protein ABSC03_00245 [Verrucomicrobiota bacterium]|jgi:hypothetical protein
MIEKSPAGTRPRTCRACGRKFEYPVKGNPATRHHCEECVALPADVRRTVERLSSRIQQLELALKRLERPPSASAAPPPGGTA